MDRRFSERRRLGEGGYATVYRARWGGEKCAAKIYVIPKRDAERDSVDQMFSHETRAYRHLTKNDEFAGRIPKFYSSDSDKKIIYLELIDGTSLRNSLHELCFDCLDQMEQFVRKTLEDLHDHGICHGDVSLDNIYPPGVLLDFSHAQIWSKRTRPRWDRWTREDLGVLKSTFREARALKNSLKAIAYIDPGIHGDYSRQEELATLVASASPTSDLLEKMKEFRRPTVALALAIVCQLRQAREYQAAIDMFAGYRAPDPLDTTGAHDRPLVKFEIELARCHATVGGKEDCNRYQKAIGISIKLLGIEDPQTIKLRYEYIECLNNYSTAEARDALTALISDLPSSPDMSKWAERLKNYHQKLSERLARRAALEEEERLERLEKKRSLEQDDKSRVTTLPTPPEKRLCLRTLNRSEGSDKENENT